MSNLLYGEVGLTEFNFKNALLELELLLKIGTQKQIDILLQEIHLKIRPEQKQQLLDFIIVNYLNKIEYLLKLKSKFVNQDLYQFRDFLQKKFTNDFVKNGLSDYNHLTAFYEQANPGPASELLVTSKLKFEIIYNTQDNRLQSTFNNNSFFNNQHIQALNKSFLSNSKLVRSIEHGIIRHLLYVRELRLLQLIELLDIDRNLSFYFISNKEKLHLRQPGDGLDVGLNNTTACGRNLKNIQPALRGQWHDNANQRCRICQQHLADKYNLLFIEDAYDLDELSLFNKQQKIQLLVLCLTTQKTNQKTLISNVYPIPEQAKSLNSVDYTLLVTDTVDQFFINKLVEVFLLAKTNSDLNNNYTRKEIEKMSRKIIKDDSESKFKLQEFSSYLG